MKGAIGKGFYRLLLITGLAVTACNQTPNKINGDNIAVTDNAQPTPQWEQRVFAVNIVADSAKLAKYLDYHQHIWPEVEAGFKKAGYKEITVSRFNHLLVMTVVTAKGANLDSMSKVAESSNAKCAEWNQLMGPYQTGIQGTAPGQKWVELKPFYHFENR